MGRPCSPSAAQLAAALGEHQPQRAPALPGRSNHLHAGVLVPLLWNPDPVVVVTERSRRMRNHAGEICFPGGRPEPGDDDLEHTALREAHEEIGLVRADVLGRLSSIPLYTSDFRLEPFVAVVPPQPLGPRTEEVDRVLHVDPHAVLETGWTHGIPWTQDGEEHLAPAFDVDDRVLYGGTAYVLYELLCVMAPLYGARPPELRPGRYTWEQVLGGAA